MKSYYYALMACFAITLQPALSAEENKSASTNAVAETEMIIEVNEDSAEIKAPAQKPLSGLLFHDLPSSHLTPQLDASRALAQVPSASVQRNGALAGLAQVRGISSDRVKVKVDGNTCTPACNNRMDAPLGSAGQSRTDRVIVMPSTAPVSAGGDHLGSVISVESNPLEKSDTKKTRWSGQSTASYRGDHHGFGGSIIGEVANDDLGFQYLGDLQKGGELRTPRGQVRASDYDTTKHDFKVAHFNNELGTFEAHGGFERTYDTGTPALGMDITDYEVEHIGLKHRWNYEDWKLDTSIFASQADHRMDNYTLRPSAMRMFAIGKSRDLVIKSMATKELNEVHSLSFGLDYQLSNHRSDVTRLSDSASRANITPSSRNRFGHFLESQSKWTDEFQTVWGIRSDTVLMESAEVGALFPGDPVIVQNDRTAFNQAGRSKVDFNFDFVLQNQYRPNEWSAYELAFSRRTRSPDYLERYLWTPRAANAGLADGRNYFGNPELRPETAYTVSLGGKWDVDKVSVGVSPYYTYVHDYIQGSPINRILNGNQVLQYQNFSHVDIHGIEFFADYTINQNFALRNWASYTRGQNHSSGDNLYRISPFHGTSALEFTWEGLKTTFETQWAMTQEDVSAYNRELKTSGYAVLNLRGEYEINKNWKVFAGVENLLDHLYFDHLQGINRVTQSSIAVGDRIPNAGRYIYTSVQFAF